MQKLNRRDFLGATAAAGAAVVGGLGRLTEARAASAAAELTPGVPEGISSYVTMATLPGKKPLIQLSDRAAKLRNAARVSAHPDHAERRVLYPLSPG